MQRGLAREYEYVCTRYQASHAVERVCVLIFVIWAGTALLPTLSTLQYMHAQVCAGKLERGRTANRVWERRAADVLFLNAGSVLQLRPELFAVFTY